ncbi:MAG: Racemase domain protein [Candidatus Roizmanbacteria bacterium GW2011_GWC2_37_13]|uniref:Racemase domain protein n=1 Tax=Candidatus Roizmanbacteria bacterium GW2011_GWC2_37_13 TaxID=1618486 RepID=A0A0G0J9D8_9BACT|nr:MAG: Racemase domain protein [Candidatus Roizmanbacteria bacterium GW2011_GWC1_37_12]KKQ24726.1 MAG: Racemase domain protein [Candidatus Roizmanbacteria bacterium GW2011_GWC2_37_13]
MKRDRTIDTLRGLAMFAMMVIHACSYYLKDKTTLFIWDNLQWAVPVFVFCSFYLFFGRKDKFSASDWLPYLKKRLTKLLTPYYYFLAVFFPLLFFFEKNKFNLKYFFANVFLYKGLDFNWLVLLFLYLTFIMPLVLIIKKNKVLFYGFFIISFISSIYFIFKPINYRAIMWLPWTAYIYFTIFFLKNKTKAKVLLLTGSLSLIVFIYLRIIETNIGHNLTQFTNKYPPTLYHLSFGIFWIIILYWLSEKNVFNFLKSDRFFNFLSINSYSLYFIHIIVMFMISWLGILPPVWPLFFLEIISISLLIQMGLNKLENLIS